MNCMRATRSGRVFTTGCFPTCQRKLNGACLLLALTARLRRNKPHLTPALPLFSQIHFFQPSATCSQSEAERDSLRSFAANGICVHPCSSVLNQSGPFHQGEALGN